MLTEDLIEIKTDLYVQSIIPQLQNLKLETNYRNQLLKSLKPTLKQPNNQLFELLL